MASMQSNLDFAIDGRESANSVASEISKRMDVKRIPCITINRGSVYSFEEICDTLEGAVSFFIVDESSKNYFRHIRNSQEFILFMNDIKNIKHTYFQIYKYVDGLKISFDFETSYGFMARVKCFHYKHKKQCKATEHELEFIVGAEFKEQIYEILAESAKFIYDEYFVTNAKMKVKFIIGVDGKLYLYKLYRYKQDN